jgi:hypothetical protein
MARTKQVPEVGVQQRRIDFIVVHCTATKPSTAIENIIAYWRKTLGWKSPGYHRIIDAWGKVTQLANEEQVTNGVGGHNAHSLHISYIGGVDDKGKAKDTRSPQQKAALIAELQAWRAKYPEAIIQGHRDFSEDKNGNGIIDPWERIKECPSFDAKAEYNFI